MGQKRITVFCGEGRGKTSAALGQAIFAASEGKTVIMIQFLKGKAGEQIDFIKRLEPEIKVFSFEKSDTNFQLLSAEEQQEEVMNIRNGMNFARKVLATGGCDILILDEILGVVDENIITREELETLIQTGDEDTEIILTGIHMCESLYPYTKDVVKLDVDK